MDGCKCIGEAYNRIGHSDFNVAGNLQHSVELDVLVRYQLAKNPSLRPLLRILVLLRLIVPLPLSR